MNDERQKPDTVPSYFHELAAGLRHEIDDICNEDGGPLLSSLA